MADFIGKWKEYRDDNRFLIKITLEDFGLPEFEIFISNPAKLTSSEVQELVTRTEAESREEMSRLQELYLKTQLELKERVDSGSMTEEDMMYELSGVTLNEISILSLIERELIKSWNLTNPETGDILPIPIDDSKCLRTLPTEIQKFIQDKIHLAFTGGEIVPKAKEID